MTPPTSRQVLVLNAGSSSLKFAVFEGLGRTWHGQVEGIGAEPRFSIENGRTPAVSPQTPAPAGWHTPEGLPHTPAAAPLPASTRHATALELILRALAERGIHANGLAACGHRIVHGGTRYVAPALIGADGLDALNALRTLAPLHNGFGLDAIEALRTAAPALPQVACFDTAFHATVPKVESRYALPAELHDAGYRRFGFHGLNFEHVTAVAAERAGTMPQRLLIFHLGNGSSICAVKHGQSVATTMGYSTLDGLVMGTRCGAIDPGVLIALQRDRGLPVAAIEDLLYRRSGLLAVSGHSPDMRALLARDDDASRFAVEHFCYWAARQAASLVAALGGVDAVAFTAGIGYGSAPVRARIIAHLTWLGLELDEQRNQRQDDSLAAAHARSPIWRVEANEELAIARHVHATIGGA